MSSKYVLFVVISLLLVAIVSSSGLKAHALPPDPKYGHDCGDVTPPTAGHYYQTCCWKENDILNPGEKITWCQTCETDSHGTIIACGAPKSRVLPGGNTGGLLNLTNAQNGGPINLPGGKNTGPPSNTNGPPTSNGTTGNPILNGTTGSQNLPIKKAGSSNTAPNNTTILLKHKKGSSSSSTEISQSGNTNSNPSSVVEGNSGNSNNNNEKSPSGSGGSEAKGNSGSNAGSGASTS